MILDFIKEAKDAKARMRATVEMLNSMRQTPDFNTLHSSIIKGCGLHIHSAASKYEEHLDKSLYQEALSKCRLPSLIEHCEILTEPLTFAPEATKVRVSILIHLIYN